MISTIPIDYTAQFNVDKKIQLDVSGWDYVLAQFVTPSGTVTFKTTLDGGAVEGVGQGDAKSATNWLNAQGLNTATNTSAVSTTTSTIFKFNVVGKFLQFESVGQTVAKLLVYYSKIC